MLCLPYKDVAKSYMSGDSIVLKFCCGSDSHKKFNKPMLWMGKYGSL